MGDKSEAQAPDPFSDRFAGEILMLLEGEPGPAYDPSNSMWMSRVVPLTRYVALLDESGSNWT